MAEVILMPRLSDTMTEGVIAAWHKKIGDPVKKGDLLAEVETDKATMEMETFDDGIVHKILVPAGQKVPCGTPIAMLLTKGEVAPADGALAVAVKTSAPAVATPAGLSHVVAPFMNIVAAAAAIAPAPATASASFLRRFFFTPSGQSWVRIVPSARW